MKREMFYFSLAALTIIILLLILALLPAIVQGGTEKIIYVNIKKQVLAIKEKGEILEEVSISSGKKGHETPKGEFQVIEKREKHYSNLWPKPSGGAPMPFAIRFYGPYWIHGGNLPGWPASHGCIRLEKRNAEKLFNWTNIGTLVIIK